MTLFRKKTKAEILSEKVNWITNEILICQFTDKEVATIAVELHDRLTSILLFKKEKMYADLDETISALILLKSKE